MIATPFKIGIEEAIFNPHIKNRSQVLAKMYGGKWNYDGIATWNCDDGVRSVTPDVFLQL